MRIGIIGGGAIGLLFANYLSEQHTVTIYTRTPEQAMLLNRNGLIFLRNGKSETRIIAAKKLAGHIVDEELVIVTVKQYHLSDIYFSIRDCQMPLLFLQNGYGHIDFLKTLRSPSLFVGVIEHGALRHNLHTVEHTGLGKTKLAVFRGSWSEWKLTDEAIESFPFVRCEDYHSMLMEKLIVNAVINPLTAILGVPNGKLISNSMYHKLMERYYEELAVILDIQSIDSTWEHVKQVCQLTAHNRSSMLKDLENGSPTEIDAILGYILSKAKQTKREHRLTNFLYFMIKGKELKEG